MALASISELIDEVRQGRMIVLVDDPDRENEGDLCIAAEFATPKVVNFIRRAASGLMCMPIESAKCDHLGLPAMVSENRSPRGTGFTVSVEAREGVTTGISAEDMTKTIQTVVADDAKASDLVRPGHVFPLRAVDGGVLARAGHTEAIVDLCRLADLKPAGLVCEIQNEDGSMARLPQLEEFAERHELKLGAIADLVEFRRRRERLIERRPVVRMPTTHGYFDLYPYRSTVDGRVHVAFTHGIPRLDDDGARFPPIDTTVLVRVHSECLTGDVFGSQRCDCGEQLQQALARVQEAEAGVLLYIRQEGRGIGLEHKLAAYNLQEGGMDTVEANMHLGFKADQREYGTGAQILHDLGVRQMRLLTNNPKKLAGLEGYGLEITEQVPLKVTPTVHNERYLQTKKRKLGHLLD
ncbi:MAG: bifunctional 3,4-dihydroxy-2-butanone-4-phosphate synthase/GTP cyclohydrolase II [Planctomycetota bacterium]|nr:bifunctional 3,4-dihydroxy-2-butanone-4-phosphate synthase/GTP cyclohydrolase II [Planctomycetota bacterium]